VVKDFILNLDVCICALVSGFEFEEMVLLSETIDYRLQVTKTVGTTVGCENR
jgi:hypothetical protein